MFSDEDRLAKVRQRMLAAYLPTYCSEVLRGPPEYDYKFLLGAHHLEWGDLVNQHGRILNLAARDHGKSHFWCMGYPLWQAHVRSPGRLGYIFSATDQQAREHLDKIRKEVEGGGEHGGPNPALASLLPFKKNSARVLQFANNSEIRARGFGTRVRGGHPWWAVGDDMLNDDHIWSETIRSKAVDYYLSAIEPMPVPGGQMIVVGTPFHAQDLYRHLENTGVYHTTRHPALDAVTGQPLWPARYDYDALMIKKRLMGSSLRWSREFLCQPISDDSSLFPSTLFEQDGVKQPYALGLPRRYWTDQGFTLYMGVDLAISASASADWLVAFVIAIDDTGSRWIVDIARHKGMGYQDQVDLIVSLSKRYDCGLVFVEANQFQRVISDMIIRTSDAPIKAFYTTGRGGATTRRRGMTGVYSANKNALDRGVPSLRMLFENRKIHIPWDESTRERVQVWITEMQSFGFAEGKLQGVGAHDDTVMALWMADQAVRLGGSFSVDFGEDLFNGESRMPSWLGENKDGKEDDKEEDKGPDWFGADDADSLRPQTMTGLQFNRGF